MSPTGCGAVVIGPPFRAWLSDGPGEKYWVRREWILGRGKYMCISSGAELLDEESWYRPI
jgi:hypothetical protein